MYVLLKTLINFMSLLAFVYATRWWLERVGITWGETSQARYLFTALMTGLFGFGSLLALDTLIRGMLC